MRLDRWVGMRIARLDEAEYGLLPYLCRLNKTSVDIGANRGRYTYWMLRHSDCVIAFEPSPEFCARLRRLFPTGVDVREAVVSDRSGQSELRVPLMYSGRMREYNLATIEPANALPDWEIARVPVDMVTLDELNLDRIGFIKIDVEGHELSVLHGARRLLADQHPRLLVECENHYRPEAIESVALFLSDLSYEGFYLYKDRLRPIAQFEPDKLQNPKHDRYWTLRLGGRYWTKVPYIRNFVFIHSTDRSFWRKWECRNGYSGGYRLE
jgi:FkbM family methyltransferase